MDIRGVLKRLRKKKKKEVVKRTVNKKDTVDKQKNSILWIIDNDGSYILPNGYQNREYETAHFEAVTGLINDGIICSKGSMGNRATHWGRVRPK